MSAREPLGLSSEAETSFLRVYLLSHPPKDSCWEVLTASIQINFPYRNDSLVKLIKQCLLWNHILIEIIAHRTSPTPQRRRSAESKWFIDFLFLFFSPSRKWSRQISDEWKDRNSKWASFNSPFGTNCHLLCGCFQTCGCLNCHTRKKAWWKYKVSPNKLNSPATTIQIILVLVFLRANTWKVVYISLLFFFVLIT